MVGIHQESLGGQGRTTRYQFGFSMVEVLVSMLVLALGVIGAAGLQLASLRTSKQTAFQARALQLASEMADRMRANDQQMKLSGGNRFLNIDYRAADGDPPPPAKLCYAQACDAGELAEFDIFEWQRRLGQWLPGGRVKICHDAAPWSDAKHAFSWECKPGAGDGASLVIKLGWQVKNPDGSPVQEGAEYAPSVVLTVEPYVR